MNPVRNANHLPNLNLLKNMNAKRKNLLEAITNLF